jgi:hypothetical protein
MATMFQRFTGASVSATLFASMALVPAAPAVARSDDKYDITCEARGRAEQFCYAPNRKVKIADDYSGRCDKGDTWRYDDRGIYVRDGCAARFRVTSNRYGDYGGDNDNGEYGSRKKDNTGTIVGAAVIGAGLLWLISQSAKNKKKSTDDQTSNSDWINPDDSSSDVIQDRYTPAEQRALDVCDARVREDVRLKGGQNAQMNGAPTLAFGGQVEILHVTAKYTADFNRKNITRTVSCTVRAGKLTDYRLS